MEFLDNLQQKLKPPPKNHGDVEFWHDAERSGWLFKQSDVLKQWRRRWFILKEGRIFWFKVEHVTPDDVPRGIIEVQKCLSIKGAEDIINKPHAFEISTHTDNMFYFADSDKEKEDWINAVGRAIVKHSKSMLEQEQQDYTI